MAAAHFQAPSTESVLLLLLELLSLMSFWGPPAEPFPTKTLHDFITFCNNVTMLLGGLD
jgi:hypothetical protein